jgi:hypothetical protein
MELRRIIELQTMSDGTEKNGWSMWLSILSAQMTRHKNSRQRLSDGCHF